jgi:hypothetical protein
MVEFAALRLVNHRDADIGGFSNSRADRARILLPGQPLEAILTPVIWFCGCRPEQSGERASGVRSQS